MFSNDTNRRLVQQVVIFKVWSKICKFHNACHRSTRNPKFGFLTREKMRNFTTVRPALCYQLHVHLICVFLSVLSCAVIVIVIIIIIIIILSKIFIS